MQQPDTLDFDLASLASVNDVRHVHSSSSPPGDSGPPPANIAGWELAQRLASMHNKTALDWWESSDYREVLVDMLPNDRAAERDWGQAVAEATRLSATPAPTVPDVFPDGEQFWRVNSIFTHPLSDSETARSRYLRSIIVPVEYEVLGPRWGPALFLYIDCLPPPTKLEFLDVFSVLGVLPLKLPTPQDLRSVLKKLGDVAKKHGERFSPYWRFYGGLDMLGGFLPAVPLSRFEEELRQWVEGTKIHGVYNNKGEYDQELFGRLFRRGVDEFLSLAPNVLAANLRDPVTEESYSTTASFMGRAGATSSREKLFGFDGDRRVAAERTKWSTALVDLEETMKRAFSDKPEDLRQLNKAVEKLEKGKVRAVASSEDGGFIRMDFVSQWLETALQGHPKTTLYMSSAQIVRMWELSATEISEALVSMPFDQAHFDWQQNKEMLIIALDAIFRFIQERCTWPNVSELLRNVERVKRSLTSEEAHLLLRKEGGETVVIIIEKGIISGWRWTAFLDTMMNYGEAYVAEKVVSKRLGTSFLRDIVAQGDDDKFRFTRYAGAIGLYMAYLEMNFEANPSKFWISFERDEYLRQVIEPNVVWGYPARVVGSLLWRSPISRDPVAGELRFRESWENWNLFMSRGMSAERTIGHAVRDLANANGISEDEARIIISTPAAVGGMGSGPISRPSAIQVPTWLSISAGSVQQKVSVKSSALPGLRADVARWSALGRHVDESMISQFTLRTLTFPTAKKDVTPGRVTKVEPIYPKKVSEAKFLPQGGWPTQGNRRHTLPSILSNEVLERAIRDKDYDWIEQVYLNPDLDYVSSAVRSKSSRSVWLAWVTGDLPYRVPIVPGWSTAVVGHYYSFFSRFSFRSLYLNKHKITKLDILRAALAAETSVVSYLRTKQVRIGG